MKKYFLLTSVLALAACGGGSGGGGGAGGARAVILPALPAGLPDAISQENATSNEYVTKMKSEVVVAAKGGHSYLARSSAPIVGDDGFTFTSYRLDDVKLFAADAKTTHDGYLRIGVNATTGRIEDMTMVVGGSDATPAVARDGETNDFTAHIYEYVEDSFAKVGNTDFSVGNSKDAMKTAIASKRGFSGGTGWELVGGVWKYDTNGADSYATYDNGSGPVEFSVPDSTEGMEAALKNAYNFDDGYWTTVGENRKYVEYGDEAVYRTVGNAETTMAALNTIATTNSLTGGHWNHTDEVLPVVTLGNGLNGEGVDGQGTKLQYSDFGHFNPIYRTKDVDLASGSQAGGWTVSATGEHKEQDVDAKRLLEDYQLFAGGYAIKSDGTMAAGDRPSLDPIIGATYKGMAIGRVYTSMEFEGGIADHSPYLAAYGITSGDGHDISKAFTTHNATMKITESGGQVVQTLNMPFYTNPDVPGEQYYDVTIVKTGNVVGTPTFTAANENNISSEYRLYDADEHWNVLNASFNPGYYGVDTPSEAAGTAAIRATYEAVNDVATRDYEVQAAWGMIKQ